MKKSVSRLLCVLGLMVLVAPPAGAVQTFLGSTFSKQSTTAEFLTELDTTITVTTTAESWFGLVNARVTNTTGQIVTVTMTLRESLLAVADETVTLSLAPGTSTVQLPKQYQGVDLGVGPHTFRVRVNQNTNSPINYQVETYLGLFNNTGTGGVVSGGGDVVGPASSVDRYIPVFDGITGKLLADNGHWLIPTTGTLTGVLNSTSLSTALQTGVCQGSKAGGHTCESINEISVSATAGAAFVGQAVTVSGVNNGSGSQNIGTFYNVANGTINTAVYAFAGDIVLGSGKIANLNDTTPDAYLDIATTSTDTAAAGLFTTDGTAAGSHSAVSIVNSKTGGSGGFKVGLEITDTGAYTGVNIGVLASASGGTSGNYGLAVLAGDVLINDGQTKANQSDATRPAVAAACTWDAIGLGRCYSITTTSDGTNLAPTGLYLSVDTGTGGTVEGDGIYVDVNGAGAASATAVDARASGATRNTAVSATCSSPTGSSDDCIVINSSTSSSSATVGGMTIITSGNGGTSTAIGLSITATSADTRQALDIVEGSVNFGPSGTLEDLHWSQLNSQFIFNVDNGTATDVGTNTIELHNDLGEIGFQIYATGSGAASGAGIAVTSTGAVTTSASGNIFANSQTSSTSSVTKHAIEAASTGTWDGTGAINSAVSASASGGTENFAFDALQGGIRNGGRYVDVAQAETCADTGNGSNQTLTLSVTQAYVIITQSDTQGCDITMSETGIRAGTIVDIECQTGGGACNFADTGGVTEIAGIYAAGNFDMISLRYNGSAWVERGRSNN